MNFFRKLERKFGRFAIPNLMYYIIMMYAGWICESLFNRIFTCSIWRLMQRRSCGDRYGES